MTRVWSTKAPRHPQAREQVKTTWLFATLIVRAWIGSEWSRLTAPNASSRNRFLGILCGASDVFLADHAGTEGRIVRNSARDNMTRENNTAVGEAVYPIEKETAFASPVFEITIRDLTTGGIPTGGIEMDVK